MNKEIDEPCVERATLMVSTVSLDGIAVLSLVDLQLPSHNH